MLNYFKEILVGFGSLLGGMAVTIKYFIKPIVTVQYPREKIDMSPRYRGHIQLSLDEETKTHRCIACEMCARICPSQLITVAGVKLDPKKKVPWKYVIEYQYCSLCGLCLESCPTDALMWSNEYRMAGFARQDSVVDILTRFQWQQRLAGVPATPIPAEPQPEAEGEEAPKKAEKPAAAKAPKAAAPEKAEAAVAEQPEATPAAPAPEKEEVKE